MSGLFHLVFSGYDPKDKQRLVIIRYVRLDSVAFNEVIKQLITELEEKYTSVQYYFDCDGSVGDSASPRIFTSRKFK